MQPKMNTALSLVVAVGNRIVLDGPRDAVLAREPMANKRRKRPLTGRGKYGANLMAHFERKEAKAA